MSIKWLDSYYTGHPGTRCLPNVAMYPREDQVWKLEDLKFVLRGLVTTRSEYGGEQSEISTTFFEVERYVYRGNPAYSPELCFQAGRQSGTDMVFPEDPSYKKVLARSPQARSLFRLEDPRVLPSTGPLGDSSSVSYSVTAQIVEHPSGQVTETSREVVFSMCREDFDPSQIVKRRSCAIPSSTTSVLEALGDLQFCLDHPNGLTPGRPFCLDLHVEPTEALRYTGQLEIQRCSISLLEKSLVNLSPDETIRSTKKHAIFQRDFQGDEPVVVLSADTPSVILTDWLSIPPFPKETPPSFSLQQCERDFDLIISIEAKLDGHTTELHFECGQVMIYPREFAEMVDAQLDDGYWGSRYTRPYCDPVNTVKSKYGLS